MHRPSLRTLGSALALTLGVLLAGPAVAQQQPTREQIALEERQIETDHRSARQACDSFSGNAKDICVEQAKARQEVAKAELEMRRDPTPRHAEKLARVRADSQWRVARQRCEDMRGQSQDLCEEEADAARTRALADLKASRGSADDRADAARDKADAQYRLELERCDTLAGPAKSGCLASARSRFGKD